RVRHTNDRYPTRRYKRNRRGRATARRFEAFEALIVLMWVRLRSALDAEVWGCLERNAVSGFTPYDIECRSIAPRRDDRCGVLRCWDSVITPYSRMPYSRMRCRRIRLAMSERDEVVI